MSRLFWMHVRDQQKMLLAILGLAVLFMLASMGLESVSASSLFQGLSVLTFCLSLLFCGAGYVVTCLLSALQFRKTFLTGSASLYRTLPLSRQQLFWSCFLSAIVCALEVTAGFALCACLRDIDLAASLFRALSSNWWFLLVPVVFILQQIVVLLNLDLGLLLGYERPSDKLAWSILFIILLYLGVQIVSSVILFPYLWIHQDMAQAMLVPTSFIQSLLLIAIGIDLAAGGLFLAVILHRMKKGMDIAG